MQSLPLKGEAFSFLTVQPAAIGDQECENLLMLELLNSAADKELIIEFLQYQKRRVEIKLKFIYRRYSSAISDIFIRRFSR